MPDIKNDDAIMFFETQGEIPETFYYVEKWQRKSIL